MAGTRWFCLCVAVSIDGFLFLVVRVNISITLSILFYFYFFPIHASSLPFHVFCQLFFLLSFPFFLLICCFIFFDSVNLFSSHFFVLFPNHVISSSFMLTGLFIYPFLLSVFQLSGVLCFYPLPRLLPIFHQSSFRSWMFLTLQTDFLPYYAVLLLPPSVFVTSTLAQLLWLFIFFIYFGHASKSHSYFYCLPCICYAISIYFCTFGN